MDNWENKVNNFAALLLKYHGGNPHSWKPNMVVIDVIVIFSQDTPVANINYRYINLNDENNDEYTTRIYSFTNSYSDGFLEDLTEKYLKLNFQKIHEYKQN